MRWCLTILASLCGCAAAVAGPWPREAGETFLAISAEAPVDGNSRSFYYTIYGEYGLTDWLTLGFDGGSDYYTQGEGYAFARVPVPLSAPEQKFALIAGMGGRLDYNSLPEYLYMVGASWGVGFNSDLGAGWATVDATLRHRQDSKTSLLKIDTTIGIRRSSGQLWFAQFRYANEDLAASPTWEIAPAMTWPLWGETQLETSASVGLGGSDHFKLKLGIWTEF